MVVPFNYSREANLLNQPMGQRPRATPVRGAADFFNRLGSFGIETLGRIGASRQQVQLDTKAAEGATALTEKLATMNRDSDDYGNLLRLEMSNPSYTPEFRNTLAIDYKDYLANRRMRAENAIKLELAKMKNAGMDPGTLELEKIRLKNEFEAEQNQLEREHEASQAQLDREFKTGERVAGQEFTTSERLGSQEFKSGETAEDRAFQLGKLSEQQAFEASQSEIGRDFTTSERIATQEYESLSDSEKRAFEAGQQEARQEFAASQSALGRAHTTGERLGSQEFKAGEAALGRSFEGSQSALDRAQQLNRDLIEDEFIAEQNRLDRLDNRIQAGLDIAEREDQQRHEIELKNLDAELNQEKQTEDATREGDFVREGQEAVKAFIERNPGATPPANLGFDPLTGNPVKVRFLKDGGYEPFEETPKTEAQAQFQREDEPYFAIGKSIGNLETSAGTVNNILDITSGYDETTGNVIRPHSFWDRLSTQLGLPPISSLVNKQGADYYSDARPLAFKLATQKRIELKQSGVADAQSTDADLQLYMNEYVDAEAGKQSWEQFAKNTQYIRDKEMNNIGSGLLSWIPDKDGNLRLYAFNNRDKDITDLYDPTLPLDVNAENITNALSQMAHTETSHRKQFTPNNTPIFEEAVAYMLENKSATERAKAIKQAQREAFARNNQKLKDAGVTTGMINKGSRLPDSIESPKIEEETPKVNQAEMFRDQSEGFAQPMEMNDLGDGRFEFTFEDGSKIRMTPEQYDKLTTGAQ